MKKALLFTGFILTLALLAGQDLSAQTTMLKVRTKQTPPPSFQPGNLTGTLTPNGVSRFTQPAPNAIFQPRSLPYTAIALSSLHLEEVYFDTTGQLIFASGRIPEAIPLNLKSTNLAEPCFQYLAAIKTALRVDDPPGEFVLERYETDQLGMTHFRMQQTYKGLPVWGAEAYLHGHGDYIDLYNGRVYPTATIPTITPSISMETAVGRVTEHISTQTACATLTSEQQSFLHYSHPVAELLIYHKNNQAENATLAWHVTIRPNFLEVWEYFVNAGTGEIIHFYNNTRTDGDVTASGTDLNGVNQTFHAYLEAGTYYLADASKAMFNPQAFEGLLQVYDAQNTNPENQNFTASPVTSANNSWTPTGVSAMVNSSKAWDYFYALGRNSYNNQGGTIPSIIHMGDPSGGGYDNAFWNGQAVFYGDGATEFKPLAGGLDVGAHEHGHAYEGAASNLEYQNQSGAISETYADIAGSMVERLNWQLGEDVVQPGVFPTGCLRDMSNPHNGGSGLSDPGWQPANTSEMYTGTEDNGGVHINSGIGNFAYYKCATALDKTKAEHIFWRASFNYLTRTSQFADFRIACLQSAKDLYGDGSAEMNAVATAFDQVGITGSGGGGGGGGGGGAPGELNVNPGPDYILCYDVASNDPNSLYIAATDGQDFTPISQTEVYNRPSVMDNGSAAAFIDTDHKMRSITLTDQPYENIIQNDAIWDGVAVNKPGTMISAVSRYQDSCIWVYSYDKEEWMRFMLYNPGTQTGAETYNVLYADAMDWDYTGEYILYDAFSRVESQGGQPLEFWDVNFLHVWDNAANDWADGGIMKLFTGLPDHTSIGNPSFSKNSMHIAGFDMFDESTNNDFVMAFNMNDGSGGIVYDNGSVLGTPNYSKLDDHLIFTTYYDGHLDIASIPLQPDKVTPSDGPTAFIQDGQWGVWFAQGTRPIAVEERSGDRLVKIYPNPTQDRVVISIDQLNNEPVQVSLFDIQGRQVVSRAALSKGSLVPMDLPTLKPGLYIVRVQGKDFTVTGKVTVR